MRVRASTSGLLVVRVNERRATGVIGSERIVPGRSSPALDRRKDLHETRHTSVGGHDGRRAAPGSLHCIRRQCASHLYFPGVDVHDDGPEGEGDDGNRSIDRCSVGEDGRDHAPIDYGSACDDITDRRSIGKDHDGDGPTGDFAPAPGAGRRGAGGHGTTGNGTTGYGTTGYGTTDHRAADHDDDYHDDQSGRRRGWSRLLTALSCDRGRMLPDPSEQAEASMHLHGRPEWRMMGA